MSAAFEGYNTSNEVRTNRIGVVPKVLGVIAAFFARQEAVDKEDYLDRLRLLASDPRSFKTGGALCTNVFGNEDYVAAALYAMDKNGIERSISNKE